MNKSKKNKLILLMIILIILIIILKIVLNTRTINYKLNYENNNFTIRQTYKNSSYYINIETKKNLYPLQILGDFGKKRKIIEKIYYYHDDNYECILPIIENSIKTDLLCYKEDIIYNYSSIKGEHEKLDNFVNNIKEYEGSLFEDKLDKKININNTIKIYTNNVISNTVAITTYKGLVINNQIIEIFKNDVYDNQISTFVDKYYVIADYDDNYDFNYFYVVDLDKYDVNKIKSKTEISFDSYIQGIVDNKVYLYDKDNEIQYEIDAKNKKINIVSTQDSLKYYASGKWEMVNKAKANKELYFDNTSLDNNYRNYDYVFETNNYFYLLKKYNNEFNLYKVDKSYPNIYRYIGEVPTNKIYCDDNFLYYEYKNKLYYYSDITGFKTILENSELEFNNTIKYYVY